MGAHRMKGINQILWNRVLSKGRKLHRGLAKGDTIVEVMISMAVLSIVIATTYSLSTRAFKSGQDSQYRDQAVSFNQQQVELIKEADNSKPQSISQYLPPPSGTGPASGTPFCISPQTKAFQTGAACNNINNLYTVSVVYNSAKAVFKITTSWVSPSGTNQNTVVFYKPSDSFIGSPAACAPPVDPNLCAPILTNVPAVNVTPIPSQPNAPATIAVQWDYTDVAAGSCHASGSGGFSGYPLVTANSSGTYTTPTLTPGTYTFRVDCSDNAGNPVTSGDKSVTLGNPSPIATTGTATSVSYNAATLNGTVNPNGFATTYIFNYGTTTGYGSSTAATSAGAGTSDTAASTAASGLTFNTTYHFQICATNAYGTTCGNDATFATPNSPPPVINQFSPDQSTTLYTGQGVNRTFTIATSFATSCNINGIPEPTNGTSSVIWSFPNTTYRLTCFSPAGSDFKDVVFSYHETQVITIDGGFLCGWMYDWAPVGCSETTGLVQVVEGKVAISYGGVCQTFYEGYYGDYGSIPRAYGVGVNYNLGRDCNNY
jgi:Tfp pilus assembly protein PilV